MFQNWEFLILEIWGHLLAAVVLTLILSWALWGVRARSERAELVSLRENLQQTERKLEVKDSDLTQAFQKQEQLKDRMSGFQTKLAESVAAQKVAEESAAAERQRLVEANENRNAIQKELSQTQAKLAALEASSSSTKSTVAAPHGSFAYKFTPLRDGLSKVAQKTAGLAKNVAASVRRKI